LRWNGERVEIVEIIGSTGSAPFPRCLRFRYEDRRIGAGPPAAIYLPGPTFDTYVAAAKHCAEAAKRYGLASPERRAAERTRYQAEDAAFRAHPAGAAWRESHFW